MIPLSHINLTTESENDEESENEENSQCSFDSKSLNNEFNEESPPNVQIQGSTLSQNLSWSHIEDLDTFFSRVYNYHNHNGLFCIVVEQIFELFEFIFIIILAIFFTNCIDYKNFIQSSRYWPGSTNPHNATQEKPSLWKILDPSSMCFQNLLNASFVFKFFFVVLAIILIVKIIKILIDVLQNLEIRKFYTYALGVQSSEIHFLPWLEVQARIRAYQKESKLCIFKEELTDLDIHHRLLRFENYFISMINHSLFPFILPTYFSDFVLLTHGLKFNLMMILFKGPGSPFKSSWQLKDEYKRLRSRNKLGRRLYYLIITYACLNLILSPFIFIYQIIYALSYGHLFKRNPSIFSTRVWSIFALSYLRHFNELDRELRERLSQAYPHALAYVSAFSSPVLTVIAKFGTFFCGTLITLFIMFGTINEDIFLATHVLRTFTALGIMIAFSFSTRL